jgi:hypothetical protein
MTGKHTNDQKCTQMPGNAHKYPEMHGITRKCMELPGNVGRSILETLARKQT